MIKFISHFLSYCKNTVSTEIFLSILKSWYVVVSRMDKIYSNSLKCLSLSMAVEINDRGKLMSSFQNLDSIEEKFNDLS